MTNFHENDLRSGRVPCPSCGRKGVGYAPHPHALGWKDYTRARCRYCQKTFKRSPRKQTSEAQP